jgi:hypothetical protein
MFYQYIQNNSGGRYDIDDSVTYIVLIEASNAREADSIAEAIGIYFDGCSIGVDCTCCGDRWSRAYEDDATEKLLVNRWHAERGGVYLYTDKGKTKKVITEPTEVDNINAPVSLPAPEKTAAQPVYAYKTEKKAENHLSTTQLEAATIYRMCVDAIALPTIYDKASVELAISTLKKEMLDRFEEDEKAEKKIAAAFIEYLEEIKK